MVCIMLSGEMVLADDYTGKAEQGGSVDRAYCLDCHGGKGPGNDPVADMLTPRPAGLTSEMLQKKDEEFLKIICEGKSGTTVPCWKGT